MFGFFRILKSNRELSEARAEVARLAAENERTASPATSTTCSATR